VKSGTKPLKPVVAKASGHWQLLQHWVVIYKQQLDVWHQLFLLHLI